MRVRISKHRGGAAIWLPDELMQAAGFAIGQTVAIAADQGRLVIEAIRAPKYDLDQLLAQMSPESAPDHLDFGPETGREVW